MTQVTVVLLTDYFTPPEDPFLEQLEGGLYLEARW